MGFAARRPAEGLLWPYGRIGGMGAVSHLSRQDTVRTEAVGH